MIKVRFPDGNELSYDDGITPFEIAEKISPSLATSTFYLFMNYQKIGTRQLIYVKD